MEFENESSVPSSPSQSDLDEFYSLPSSPVILGTDGPNSPSQIFNNPGTSSSSSSSLPIPPGNIPQVQGNEHVWKQPHQIDPDHSFFSRSTSVIINNLRMTFVFHVDESLPFRTNQIWAPFCEAQSIVMNNPAIGNMIYYDTDPEYSPMLPQSEGHVAEAAWFTGIRSATLSNVNIVYTANNSGQNPDFKYEQLKISAPFYKSRSIELNNPVIQLITVIKDGGKRHRCPPEKIPARNVIWAPFFKARYLEINNASLLQTDETQALFSCPCLLSTIACNTFVAAKNVEINTVILREMKKKLKDPTKPTNLLKLLQRPLIGVELDSILRWPHPRCHGGTRSSLRQKIITWLLDDNRKQDALWLHGDAGSGKSAVAQTMGEYADQRGILGAAAFISRSKKLNDSTRIITSISLQLAQRNEAYERIVTKVIQDNPSILNTTTDKRTQFRELVLKPFSLLEKESPDQKKTLIILDGLDEIDGNTAQSDLVNVITEILHPFYNSPFIWLLCSRPELHLQHAFRQSRTRILYQLIVTGLDADDGHKDVEQFYLEELHRLKKEYSSYFASDTNKLGETEDFLSHVTSNPFLYASTLVRLIGDPNVSNPARQLEAMVGLVARPPLLSCSGNIYTAIDMLYLHVLETIPPHDEAVVLRLLGALTVSTPIPALYLAAIFCIPKAIFYSILRPLHSVLLVPDEFLPETEVLRFYHVSFPDFLTNSHYSREFFQDPDSSRAQLAEAQLRAIANPAALHSNTSLWYSHLPIFGLEQAKMPYYDILIHAAKTTWDICSQISHPLHQWLLDTLLNFEFQSLQDVSEAIPTYSFMHFLWWLRESVQDIQELQEIVRTSPKSDIDTGFVRACEQYHRSRRRQSIASPFPWRRDDVDEILKEPRYALAGFGDKTVLILLTPETVMVFSAEDIDDL